jgi:hypothetical protein
LDCKFIKDDNFNHPFSVSAESDIQSLIIEITYRPKDFPKSMVNLVAEVKETIEHELEHIEQQNFEDMYVPHDKRENRNNFEYLTSYEEIPAYVRGLIKRSKTKKISLETAMDEWFKENILKFKDPNNEWPLIKKIWMTYAIENREKQKVKKFK